MYKRQLSGAVPVVPLVLLVLVVLLALVLLVVLVLPRVADGGGGFAGSQHKRMPPVSRQCDCAVF